LAGEAAAVTPGDDPRGSGCPRAAADRDVVDHSQILSRDPRADMLAKAVESDCANRHVVKRQVRMVPELMLNKPMSLTLVGLVGAMVSR